MTQDDRYSRGKIYKLVSDVTDLIYIGSCCVPLRKRLCEHKSTFTTVHKNQNKSSELFKLGGTVGIILIEDYPCKSKWELERRERYHIENNVCVNRSLPAQTHEEYLEHQRERRKGYYAVNRDVILEKRKEYYDKAKERVSCVHCQKEMNRTSLSNHIKTQHP